MKPLKLIMTAFGPFAKETEIDFEKIGRQGVFLISGSNGSGKTSIFDAISFALYGETSNPDRRSKKSVHSDFASVSTKTSVILEFQHQGAVWRVERSGKCIMKDGRNQMEMKKAVLIDQNHAIIAEGQTAVNKKITDMIHMDRKQFAQTVMIAQGEFQKILNASSEDRKKLFQDLFHTGIYEQFQNKLNEKSRVYEEQADRLKEQIRREMSRIIFDAAYQPQTPPEETQISVYISLLTKQNAAQKISLSKMQEQKMLCQKERDELIRQIERGKEQNHKLEDLKQKTSQMTDLQKRKSDIQDQETRVRMAHSADYVRIQERILQTYQKNLNEKIVILNQISGNYAMQSANLANAEQILETANQAAEALDDLRQQVMNLEQARPLFQERREKENAYQRAAADLQSWNNQYQQLSQIYHQKMQNFLLGQAGLLAEGLQENQPCPVCGSMHHPSPAARQQETPSQEELKQTEFQRNQAEQQFRNTSEYCAQLNAELEVLRSNPVLQQMTEEVLLQTIQGCQQKMQYLQTQKTQAEQSFNKFKHDCEVLHSRKEMLEKEIETLKQEIINQQNLFDKALHDGGFADRNIYLASVLDPHIVQDLENQIQNYYINLNGLQNAVRELSQETAGMQSVDLSLLEQSLLQKNKTCNQLESDASALQSILKEHSRILSDLQTFEQKLNQIQKEWGVIYDLYQTVSGTKRNGQAKLRLEAYVQQYYFRRVVAQANQRLFMLTGGKFILRCSDKAKNHVSYSGLDLEVLDTNTNQWRDVSTLSGGESFLASLSLALGLSDVMQEGNGGIQLDAMFIDEGFGTLDEQALNQAVTLLGKLADGSRLVGVISHVEALKIRIESQIMVTKKTSGSEITFTGID